MYKLEKECDPKNTLKPENEQFEALLLVQIRVGFLLGKFGARAPALFANLYK